MKNKIKRRSTKRTSSKALQRIGEKLITDDAAAWLRRFDQRCRIEEERNRRLVSVVRHESGVWTAWNSKGEVRAVFGDSFASVIARIYYGGTPPKSKDEAEWPDVMGVGPVKQGISKTGGTPRKNKSKKV